MTIDDRVLVLRLQFLSVLVFFFFFFFFFFKEMMNDTMSSIAAAAEAVLCLDNIIARSDGAAALID